MKSPGAPASTDGQTLDEQMHDDTGSPGAGARARERDGRSTFLLAALGFALNNQSRRSRDIARTEGWSGMPRQQATAAAAGMDVRAQVRRYANNIAPEPSRCETANGC